MPKALESFCRTVEVRIPLEVLLSKYNRIPFEGWAWPSLMVVMCIGIHSWPTMNIPTVSDLAAEAMKLLMVLHMTWNGALVMGFVTVAGSCPKMYQAADRLRYLGKTMYAESDFRVRTISLV